MRTLNQPIVSWPGDITVASVFFYMLVGFTATGRAANTNPQNVPASPAYTPSQFAIADFDGDNRPDLATVEPGRSNSTNTCYWIAFQLSGGPLALQRRPAGSILYHAM